MIKENFWDLSPTLLLNMILTTSRHSSHPIVTHYTQYDETNGNDEGNPNHIVPSIIVSKTVGETLQPSKEPPNTELLVYTRKRLHHKSQS